MGFLDWLKGLFGGGARAPATARHLVLAGGSREDLAAALQLLRPGEAAYVTYAELGTALGRSINRIDASLLSEIARFAAAKDCLPGDFPADKRLVFTRILR